MKNFFLRGYHLYQRIINMMKEYPGRRRVFGADVARAAFIDGIIPPGKSQNYIDTISNYVNVFTKDLAAEYVSSNSEMANSRQEKFPIWCCWWQGESQMPEVVRLCHTRLKQIIPENAELHLITLENYINYVAFPKHIKEKFDAGIITMTTMSDILRFLLLEKYGGYWLDATVFFTGAIPKEYFTEEFFCQKMVDNTVYSRREACRGSWCGFSMAGRAHSIIFRYMNDAFSKWWAEYDMLIDYLLWSGYTQVPKIAELIDHVPDNNEDIFELYKVLNEPYEDGLYHKMTARNVMHKLTYKMELTQFTTDGKLTMYGFLHKMVYGQVGNELL